MYRIITTFVFLLLSLSFVQAQRLCEALVENALEQAGDNCTEQDGELVCYAYDNLSATFFETASSSVFTPSSIIDIPAVHTVKSNPLDLEEDEWGIAYLQLQANLPEATANSSVRMIMLGEVLLENAVNEAIGAPLDTVLITTSADTSLLSAPEDTAEPVSEVSASTILEAVGQSSDGAWIGVTTSGQIAWVISESITSEVDLTSLPEIEADSSTSSSSSGVATAFDELYFQTGGISDCQEAPNILVVQGPETQSVDVSLNNVPIRIGSTIGVGTDILNGEPVMWVTVISGKATLYPDSPNAIEILPMEVSYAPIAPVHADATAPIEDYLTDEPILDSSGNPYLRNIPVEGFTSPQPLTDNDIGFMSIGYYQTLYRIPANLLNYPLEETDTIVEASPSSDTEQSVTQPINQSSSTEEATSSPDVAELVINTCDPSVLNYCNAGQPWGDGRCMSDNPEETNYYYEAGWYNAALACGVIDRIPARYDPNAEDVEDGTETFIGECDASIKSNSQVFSAEWNVPVAGQAEAVFEFVFEQNNVTLKTKKSISALDTSVKAKGDYEFPYNATFDDAKFYLEDSDGTRITLRFNCK